MKFRSKFRGSSTVGPLLVLAAAALLVIGGAFLLHHFKGKKINTEDIVAAEKIAGLRFSPKERTLMLDDLKENAESYDKIREIALDNSVPPAFRFDPVIPGMSVEKTGTVRFVSAAGEKAAGKVWDGPGNDDRSDPRNLFSLEERESRERVKEGGPSPRSEENAAAERPADIEELAFAPVTRLAELIRARKITSTELTRMYLARLKRYGPRLECIVTLTEDLAIAQAARADGEIAAGRYRGPLHGIPYGAKDLLAVKGTKTTWGAKAYEDQMIDDNATVIDRLEEAGAVLVAKLTLGALAMGDVWFGGKTRNPWNTEQGSSGSSAGSAAATAAGLVGFAIGTETWGSIISPSTRCGVVGLRPTFGRVSRAGAMALSWTMDKIGPICRSVEDCALVFEAIRGPDGRDLTVADHPFDWEPGRPLESIRIGYLKEAFEEDHRTKKNDDATLEVLRSAGIELIPFEVPENLPVEPLAIILSAEAAAAFDELTRSNRDDLLVRQDRGAWPNAFRQARFIPAVEYIQANRIRTLLMKAMAERMKDIDVYVAPSFGGNNLLLTNLTGHPAVVLPNGFDEKGSPTSISFIGGLHKEAEALRAALAFEQATDFHTKHPELKEP